MNSVESKKCSKCFNLFPLDRFNVNLKLKDGITNECKNCKAIRNRVNKLKRRYNITTEEYITLLDSQDSCCAICGIHQDIYYEKTKRSFSVDHCHVTGLIRGLLCSNCNRGLGLLGDTLSSLSKAISYLAKEV